LDQSSQLEAKCLLPLRDEAVGMAAHEERPISLANFANDIGHTSKLVSSFKLNELFLDCSVFDETVTVH
jgi:hypothetical protein